MKKISLLLFAVLLSGCASVSYLPSTSQTFAPTTSVEVFWDKPPQRPYVEMGKIIVESEDFSEKTLFKKFKEKAMKVGADAVIVKLEKADRQPFGGMGAGGNLFSFFLFSSTTRRIEGLAIRWKEEK